MKRIMAVILASVMALMGLTGCSKQEPQPEVPETPVPPGTLIGVAYATGGGMMAHTEFSIRMNRNEIEHTEFWPFEEYAEEMTVQEHVPITETQWADVERVILDLYRDGALEEYQPRPEIQLPDVFVLDGGGYTNLSLIWETSEGPVEMGYYWPNDRRVLTLVDLLNELADPKGREIIWYESPQLKELYFTRNYRFNKDRDFSFQFHYASYDEADPHWELIYYLGEHGEVDNGYIRLEESDWDDFMAFAEELQLEYFPEQTKSDDRFICYLTYTDGHYKYVVLNEETEKLLQSWFMELVQRTR